MNDKEEEDDNDGKDGIDRHIDTNDSRILTMLILIAIRKTKR